MKGENVRLIYRGAQTGTDGFGLPIYEELQQDVANVLVEPMAAAEAGGDGADKIRVRYRLMFPKLYVYGIDMTVFHGAAVIVREERFALISVPDAFAADNCPTAWCMSVNAGEPAMSFEQTITIYNKRYDRAVKETLWPKTVLHGVNWSGYQAVTAGEGFSSNDAYAVTIPVSAATAGFLRKEDYQALAEPGDHFTAQSGDVVLLGEGSDVLAAGIAEITKQFTDCFTVTAVHLPEAGSLFPRLRLEGK